jgi:hypothetical protein
MKARRRRHADRKAPASDRKPLDLARMAEAQARIAGIGDDLVSAVVHRTLMASYAFAVAREMYNGDIYCVPDARELVHRVVACALADHRRGALERRV